MKAYDFEYDNSNLSNRGYIICNFNSQDLETISSGAPIEFNEIAVLGGAQRKIASAVYGTCLETVIQICKDPCKNDDLEITHSEYRKITRWLARKGYHKFKILNEDYLDLYFEATFTVSKIELDGKIYGFELTVKTNRPFALKEPRIIKIENTEVDGTHYIYDNSDEEGFIYPYMEITLKDSGDLVIYNDIEDRLTEIKNCIAGEKIVMDYPIITSSEKDHSIQNDFNWIFFRLANDYRNGKNNITVSLPCNIEIEYSPIVKVGF